MKKTLAVTGIVLTGIFARAIIADGDPTGRGSIDRVLIAGVENTIYADIKSKYPVIAKENALVRSVFMGLNNSAGQTSVVNYINNMTEAGFTKGHGYNVFDLCKAVRPLKDNPLGVRANSYTEDELRGFYFFLYHNSDNQNIVLPNTNLNELARLSISSLEAKCQKIQPMVGATPLISGVEPS